jgi:hypothetical protein
MTSSKQLETAHFGLDKTAPVVAAPFLPDRPAQPALSVQDVVTRIGTAAVRFPGLSVLAGRNDGMCGAQSDGLVAVLRVVGALLSKLSEGRADAICSWFYNTGTVTGLPSRVKRFSTAARTCSSAT